MSHVFQRTLLVFAAIASVANAGPIDFNLITLATNTTDPQLINPWGLAASATSPLWIGSNGSGVAEVYPAPG